MGHAVGLEGKNGVELLIHIGVDTVQLNGKYYTSHCSEGQEVKAGDLLMEFDMKAIKEADPHAFVNVMKTEQLSGRFYQKPTD